MSGIELLIRFKPRNRMPNPKRTSARSRFLLRLLNISGAAMAMEVRARMVMSIEKPRRATSQPVKVVPMLAPRMTPMAWTSSIKPALTKLTTMTVVADELWIRMVMTMPVTIEMARFFVIRRRIDFIRLPADFWSPSLSNLIPKRKSPRLPMICNRPSMVFIWPYGINFPRSGKVVVLANSD